MRITIENTGERYVPTQGNAVEALVNMERYHYAMTHCIDKKVLELGCGAGLGTYLYSLVAKHVTAIDYSLDALGYAQTYPYDSDKVTFTQMDLSKEIPEGNYDIVIATEFLEHIDDPASLLRELDTKYLIFALPLHSMAVSTWHKFVIRPGTQGVEDIKALIHKNYHIEDMVVQNNLWVYGKARKRKSWL